MSESSQPTDARARNLSGFDLFLLWAGAGIALPEIWAGGLIVQMGLAAGVVAILVGHLLGNTVMGSAAWIGARQGIPAIVSTRAALGYRGSTLAALLNVLQMVGWTGFMVWVAGQAAAALPGFEHVGPRRWMVVIGVVTTLWALVGHRGWRWVQPLGITLLLVLAALMTWRVGATYPIESLAKRTWNPPMSFGIGLDLVIVMPISWLPLVADYTRYARSPGSGVAGTWLGYFLASSWMYLIGLAVGLATMSGAADDVMPDTMVMTLLGGSGWGTTALGIVLISTLTTAFLNIFSNAVSAQSIWPKLSERKLVCASGLIGTLLAIAVDGSYYEPFLVNIGSAFCPLFGIVLADYYLIRRGRVDATAYFRPDGFRYWKGFNLRALIVWAAGFGLYRWASAAEWPCGAALPSLILTGLAYVLMSRIAKGRETVA